MIHDPGLSTRWPNTSKSSPTTLPRKAERIQEVAGNVKGAVDKSIQDQPMPTLAVAAAAGFVLGALWKS
jgi:ElaB/YqjD/DUF883 family membrane-anchored ribosome-binding protein